MRGSSGQISSGQLPPAVVGALSNMVLYGHSIGAGGAAVDADHRYSAIIASRLGILDDNNYAVGGAYLARDSSDGNNAGVSWIAAREKRNVTRAPYVSGRDLAILHFGYEDIMLGVANTQTGTPPAQNQTIFKNALRAALALIRSSSRKYAGDKTTNLDTSIALGTAANWSVVANPTQGYGQHIPPAYCGSVGYISTSTNGAGGAFTITIPGDYPGSSVCPLYVLLYVNGLTAGTLTASGAATGTFDLVQQVAGGTPANTSGTCDAVNARKNLIAMRFTGNAIAPSNGTVQTLTLTPSGLTGGTWGFAEWLIEAQVPTTVVIPQLDNLGNPGILVFQCTRNSDCAAFNSTITSLIAAEFNDGTVLAPSYTLNQSGNTFGKGGTAGNTTAATIVSGTGFGGTTATNCQINTVQPWPASGTAAVGSEIFTWMGVSNSGGVATLSGVTRGAWNTTASAQGSGALVDTLNVAGIPNQSTDFTHPSSRGHAIMAQAIISAVQALSLDTANRPYTAQRKARIVGIYQSTWNEQIIPPQGSGFGPVAQALNWDQALVDTAGMQNTLANVLAGVYNNLTIPADGLYDISVQLSWSIGKVTSTGVSGTQAGALTCQLIKNSVNVAEDTIGSFATGDFPNAFWLIGQQIKFAELELRAGDQIAIQAYQSGSGVLTTVSDNPLTSGATTINLASTTSMAANDVLRIGNESILIGTVASGTQLTGCTRGYHLTTAAAHNNGVNAFSGRGLFGPAISLPTRLVIRRTLPL